MTPAAAVIRLAVTAIAAITASGAVALAQAARTETVDEALCRLVEAAAGRHAVPVDFLTRLIWRESSFRSGVVSSAGAQGVAQFMPGTAVERGLADPFDPEQAIPKSAHFLADLRARFGNLGLAAAAYNAGTARIEAWLAGRGRLPAETRDYVIAITGRSADEWSAARADGATAGQDAPGGAADRTTSCVAVVASLRQGHAPVRADLPAAHEGPFAPWGVQVAGHFSKPRALAAYERAVAQHAGLFADATPMVIGTRLRFRGNGTYWRVRVPAPTRTDAETWCGRLRRAGGSCVVLRS